MDIQRFAFTEGLMKSLKITMLMAALLVLVFVLFQKNIKIETMCTQVRCNPYAMEDEALHQL